MGMGVSFMRPSASASATVLVLDALLARDAGTWLSDIVTRREDQGRSGSLEGDMAENIA